MSEIKYQKLDTLLKYLKKSKIKAGDGKEDGKYPFYTSSAKLTKRIDTADYQDESIILGSGGLASIHYAKQPFSTSTDCFVLTPIDETIDLKYVYYYLKSNIRLLEDGFKGVGLKHISKKYLSNIKIPIQSLENQRKISAFLTRLEELIEKRKESIKLLDELIKSTFLDMFGDPVLNTKGWDKKILQNMMTIRRGASPRPIKDFIGNDIHWIKIGDGTKGDELYITDTKEKIKMDGKTKSVYLKEGSVIFANCGVSLGFVRILKIDGCIHDGWLSFEKIDNETLNKIFLLKVINFSTKYLRRIASGGTQPNLNTSIMNKFKIIVPPKPLQDKFAKIVTKIEDTKKLYQNSLDELNNLFNSIAQKAFKGEVLK